MSRGEHQRFDDIVRAVERCQRYAPFLHDHELGEMAYDAILRNLSVLGEAVRRHQPRASPMSETHGTR